MLKKKKKSAIGVKLQWSRRDHRRPKPEAWARGDGRWGRWGRGQEGLKHTCILTLSPHPQSLHQQAQASLRLPLAHHPSVPADLWAAPQLHA